jgi:hypothetical protein
MFTPSIRTPRPPVNPLLTIEEDEFLYFASILFDEAGSDIGIDLRALTVTPLMLGDYARSLLNNFYLDPLDSVDKYGRKRAVMWRGTF